MTKARDIASAAPAPAGVTTTELGYVDGVTSAIQTQVDAKVAKTTLTAKGDLLTATGSGTPAVLPVSSQNGDTIVADSSTATGLRWQGSIEAGKNFLINGNFDIWQRGTTFTATNSGAYTADRWHMQNTNTMTVSRQTTGVPAGSQYCLRMTSGSSSAVSDFFQYIETANVVPLQGRTITYSVKLRRNAGNTSDALLLIQKSATVDAGSGASWTTISTASVANALLPTGTGVGDWYTASFTLTIPNDGTANSLRVYTSTASQITTNAYMELAQTQLEIGSVATTFSRAGGTIQGELAACQRYYYRQTGSNYSSYGQGAAYSTTSAWLLVQHPVTMRKAPTVIEYSTLCLEYYGVSATALTALSIDSGANNPTVSLLVADVASGLTQYRPYRLANNANSSGYFAVNAEL